MRKKAKLTQIGVLLNLIIMLSIMVSNPSYGAACTNEAHAYTSEVIKAATETENGEVKNSCIYCGDSYTETLPATGHIFGSWEIAEERDNGERLEQRTCSQCGQVEQQVVLVVPVSKPTTVPESEKPWQANTTDVVLTTATGGVWGYVLIIIWWNSLVLIWYKRECNKKKRERREHDNQ